MPWALMATLPTRPVRSTWRGGSSVNSSQSLRRRLPMLQYSSLAVAHADDLLFGRAKHPLVTRRGMAIGGGTVYPELNFTLPDVAVEHANLPAIVAQYQEIVDVLLAALDEAHARHGLKSVLRVTPNDNREFDRPPLLRSGHHWDRMLELFERGAAAGAA